MEARPLGLMHFWQAGDGVSHAVALLLLLMSLLSWYVILSKGWSAWRRRRVAHGAIEAFWSAPSLEQAVSGLRAADPEAVFTPTAEAALQLLRQPPRAALAAEADPGEQLTRVLRRAMTRTHAEMESGLTLLASVGSTAPFVGLFGTVWGIYHALLGMTGGGQVMLDQVAGPVGEALVMTAAGLLVAIPAVLAYNAFGRLNRTLLVELDGFAHDLRALAQGEVDDASPRLEEGTPGVQAALQTVGH